MKTENTDLTQTIPLNDAAFQFACNDTIPCFTRCCHDADMLLYPYDIIRLKRNLGMSSDDFLVKHTVTAFRYSPNFPSVMLKMSDKEGNPCSFLSEKGCLVYEDRPYSCRAYPLEPAMSGDETKGVSITCSLVQHDHCKGHGKGNEWTAEQWMKDQGMTLYNTYNAEWGKVASRLFAQQSFGEQGSDSQGMNMAYMAAYNMDTFRRFVLKSSFLKRYDVPKKRIKKIKKNDVELMRLGFDWILSFTGGQGPLKEKR